MRLLPTSAVALAAVAVIAAGCGSSNSGHSTTSSAGGAASGGGAAGYGGAMTSPSTTATTKAVVMTARNPLGTILTDGSGTTLYRFARDTGMKSTCYGSCAAAWPPLTTSGAPSASGMASGSQLGTTARTDGTTQVTYAGHPLYYYAGDGAPGETNGQGLNLSGGLWYVVAPNGAFIK